MTLKEYYETSTENMFMFKPIKQTEEECELLIECDEDNKLYRKLKAKMERMVYLVTAYDEETKTYTCESWDGEHEVECKGRMKIYTDFTF